MNKLNKRFMIGKIEFYYPGGVMNDVVAVTASKRKANEFVLKEFLKLHYLKFVQDQDFKTYYNLTISDLHENLEYVFDIENGLSEEGFEYLEKMNEKYMPKVKLETTFFYEMEENVIEYLKDFELKPKEIETGVSLLCKEVNKMKDISIL